MKKFNHYLEELEVLKVYQGYKLQCDYISFRIGYAIGKNKSLKLDADQYDFMEVLKDRELSADELRQSYEDMDYIEGLDDKLKISDSIVDGKGLWTEEIYEKGDIIMAYEVDGVATEAKRYCNHSPVPNAKIVKDGKNLILKAVRKIKNNEIMIDYRKVLPLPEVTEAA